MRPDDEAAFEAAVMLVRFEGRALMLRRPPEDRRFPDQWCLPGGQLEERERPEDAVLREVLEESGLGVCIDGRWPSVLARVGSASVRIYPFVGHAEAGGVALSSEHTAFRWLDRDQAARAHALLPGGLAGEVAAEMLRRFARGDELADGDERTDGDEHTDGNDPRPTD